MAVTWPRAEPTPLAIGQPAAAFCSTPNEPASPVVAVPGSNGSLTVVGAPGVLLEEAAGLGLSSVLGAMHGATMRKVGELQASASSLGLQPPATACNRL